MDLKKKVDAILERGVIVDIIPSLEAFRKFLFRGHKIRIYIGADPTSPSLHLSHGKNYMILEEFRQLGHEVIILVGDFTARIGDPTNRSDARKQLSAEEIQQNISKWFEQIGLVINLKDKFNPPVIKYNCEWLSKLTNEELIHLLSKFSVQQLEKRAMFQKRKEENKPIFLNEFIYPVMQGYDSVAMDVDVELCGTDQTFNALIGRHMLKRLKNKEKFVVCVNLMENPLTGELMSKSKGTGVFLDATPEDMFGSIMNLGDEMIEILLRNCTRISFKEMDRLLKLENPRDAKMITAYEITKIFHGVGEANSAQNRFIQKFKRKEMPEDAPLVRIGKDTETLFKIVKICVDSNLSGNKIRNYIKHSAVKINGIAITDLNTEIFITENSLELKVGKKDWFQIVK